ncbi:glyoxalase superfamily protein [Gimesia aquarii]|uniref:Bleomycin resistance protein n=1 Tax=Gimesia aquarii TaxID=2527964 RepID=A0A517X0K6_9PLAN|nr:glyoxalase superfamily protein [Gimesia aquarii]QDU11046.1 Bleomycin resistance protein [Gimesia aquarii]
MPDTARFNSAAPCLLVRDILRSLEFYKCVLGCEPGYLEADPPVYATLHRDDVTIHLALDRDGDKAGSNRCCVFVTNVDALYEACIAASAKITRKIEDSPYGLRDFNLSDPDGNEILFGEPFRK